MHIKSAHFDGFKRFTDLSIAELPATAKLVVLAGPNGSGKSSIFDGFKTWHRSNGANDYTWDESYGTKAGTPSIQWTRHVTVQFHEPMPTEATEQKKLFYVRTAFRNEADFSISSFSRLASPLETNRVSRLIDNDASVSENFQRMLMQTIDGVFDDTVSDSATKAEIRDRIIGRVRAALRAVHPDLVLTGVGGVGSSAADQGSFYFRKNDSEKFLYKNLSAGEKATFDLILDAVVKSEFYDNSIWCIDEPETHVSTRVQSTLLRTLVSLMPSNGQLWIASHSLGFMKEAWDMAQAEPGSVAFLDMSGHDFDLPITLIPVIPSRDFWARTLDVALGDLASLVAPAHVVLCEGRPQSSGQDYKAAFDATCYRTIFSSEFPGTDFISVGNSLDAGSDKLEFGFAIQTLSRGTRVDRLIDRDMRTTTEVQLLATQGVRVLGRRHIESYLLDDEVIAALCLSVGKSELENDALSIKSKAVTASIARGNDVDDMKSAAGEIFVGLRRLLGLSQAGNTWNSFARDTLAPLFETSMKPYRELRSVIFDALPRT